MLSLAPVRQYGQWLHDSSHHTRRRVLYEWKRYQGISCSTSMSRDTYPIRGSLHSAAAVPTISTRYDHALILHISGCFFTSSAAPHLGAASASLICTTICIDFTFSEQRRIHEAKRIGLPSSKEFLHLCGISDFLPVTLIILGISA
jgi:hypothetical protein